MTTRIWLEDPANITALRRLGWKQIRARSQKLTLHTHDGRCVGGLAFLLQGPPDDKE